MQDEKFYKPLDRFLLPINNQCIAMNGEDSKNSVQVTFKVLDELIEKMRAANEMFRWLFSRITYVGSYFDGLRVKEATEFDINVVLKLPLVYEKFDVKRDPRFPGYVKVNLKDSKYPEEKLKWYQKETEEIFKSWTNSDGQLSHWKVLRWWESIFSKLSGLSRLSVNGKDYKIKFGKAGPAMTARISSESGSYCIDVDLVPVIEFTTIRPPKGIKQEPGPWYIVPKFIEDDEYVWRLSFPSQEQTLMNGKSNLKVINRFLKRFRDVVSWKPVSSYYIKTIFLWEAKQKDDLFFRKPWGYLLVYFMGRLEFYLDQGKLPFYWDDELNLFQKLSEKTAINYACRIKNLRREIEKYVKEDDSEKLQQLLEKMFNPDGTSKIVAEFQSKATLNDDDSNMSLIDLESSVEQNIICWDGTSQDLSLPEPLSAISLPHADPSSNHDTQLASSEDHQVSQLTSSDQGYPSPNPPSSPANLDQLALQAAKTRLEIEECKLRLRIAELDLETANYNLKTAEKRFEIVNLQYDSLAKSTI